MKVLALSKMGQEFLYLPKTAYQVSNASAKTICKALNDCKYKFDEYNGYCWHIHEIDQYDRAFDYAQDKKFTIRKGVIKAVTMRTRFSFEQ